MHFKAIRLYTDEAPNKLNSNLADEIHSILQYQSEIRSFLYEEQQMTSTNSTQDSVVNTAILQYVEHYATSK